MTDNIIEEFNYLKNLIETETNNLINIQVKIKTFQNHISHIKEDIQNISNLDGPFSFLNDIFDNFIKIIQNNLSQFNDLVLIPLDNLADSFKFAADKNINAFKEIEDEITKSKKELINTRNTYFDYIKESENETINTSNISIQSHKGSISSIEEISSKKDESIYINALKDNYGQLYQYEMKNLDELVEESNSKYNNIIKEVKAISLSLKLSIKDSIIKFANNITLYSETFNILSKEIKEKINSVIIENKEESENKERKINLNSHDVVVQIKEEEKNEVKENKKISFKEKIKIFNIFSKKKNSTKEVNLQKKNENDNINKIEDDLEKNIETKEKKEQNIQFIDNFVKKIIGDKEIKSREIVGLYNILNLNEMEKKIENKYAKIFLNILKKSYNNRIISFKNKNNFYHLSNIMNSLCLKYKENSNILFLIIEVSQMIKYKNDYIYKIIQRNNEFFSTKTLWLQLIDNDFMKVLNEFVDNKVSEEIQRKNTFKEQQKEKKEKNNILEITGLSQKITNYKKLNNDQIKELLQFGKEKICIILSKSISGMCCFLVPELIINEIIIYYSGQFKFEYELKCYLKNKMILKNMKIRNNIKNCPEKEEKLNNKVIILSSVSKFYPIKDYVSLLKIDKKLCGNLRKSMFINLLSDPNLSIDSHIKLLKEYLQIKELKKKFKYKDIKEVIYVSLDKEQINEEIREEKNINVIEKDLLRTKFVVVNKDHFNKFRSILISFLFMFPKIGYCQGMHCVVSFLYQLLNYDEEETFYFFCAFELNTKYHELFEDNFESLNRFFQVFEKILNINRPEIYYKFMDNNFITNIYMSAWFITLLTQNVYIFDRNNFPKFVFFIIEKFIIEGWSAIFNCSFTLLEYCYDKIMTLEKDELFSYVSNIFENEEILKNENFEKAKALYLKNAKLLNEFFIERLIEITKFEQKNNYLNEIINIIGITNT